MIEYLSRGTELSTSGTTGRPKKIFQDPYKIKHSNLIARKVQNITKNSRILTVCSLKHAGGLLAQTLPAYEIGASVTIEPYNPYRWVMEIEKYTHSHLTPRMAEAIIKTKSFRKLDLSGITIMCGSDPVHEYEINCFTEQGATFIANWGMTEIGPVAINKTFQPGDVAENYLEYTVLGDTFWCDYKIVDNELHVKGAICVYPEWFATGDLVVQEAGTLYYVGRKD
mgnify:FL=1